MQREATMQDHPRRREGRLGGRHGAKEKGREEGQGQGETLPPKRPSYKMHRIFASVGENADATGRRSRHSRVRSSEIASWKISIRASKIGRTLRHTSLISSASAVLLASRRAE